MKNINQSTFNDTDLSLISSFLRLMRDQNMINLTLLSERMKEAQFTPLHPLHAVDHFLLFAHREWEKDACGSLSPRLIDEGVKEALSRFGIENVSKGLSLIEDSFQDWTECLTSVSEDLININNRLINWLDLCIERVNQYAKLIDDEGESV